MHALCAKQGLAAAVFRPPACFLSSTEE